MNAPIVFYSTIKQMWEKINKNVRITKLHKRLKPPVFIAMT